MAIDPVRLARIRTRLLAAAALAVPACGGNMPQTINEPRREPPPTQHDGPINERVEDPPPVSPNPNPPTDPPRPNEEIHINTPNPDTTTPVRSPKDAPPSGQTINTAPVAAPRKEHINTPQPAPTHHVNTPPPPPKKPDTTIINTPKPQ